MYRAYSDLLFVKYHKHYPMLPDWRYGPVLFSDTVYIVYKKVPQYTLKLFSLHFAAMS